MRRIYKYQLGFTDKQPILMHPVYQFLDVQMQWGKPYLWADVDTSRPAELYVVYVIGTGDEPPAIARHVGTVQDGPLVWHFYAERAKM